ncbi:hypothetical protein ACVIRO_004824 [Rhizobium ruizarguesonis]
MEPARSRRLTAFRPKSPWTRKVPAASRANASPAAAAPAAVPVARVAALRAKKQPLKARVPLPRRQCWLRSHRNEDFASPSGRA